MSHGRLLFVALLLGACVPDAVVSRAKVCAEGSRRACDCPDGTPGEQICLDDDRYGVCSGCSGDTTDGGMTTPRDGGSTTKPPMTDAGVEMNAAFSVTPTTLRFDTTASLDAQTVTVENTGDVPLDFTAMSDSGWLSVSASSFMIQPGATSTFDVEVDDSGLAYGSADGSVLVRSTPTAPEQSIAVRLVVREDYDIPPPTGTKLSVVGFTMDESDPDDPHLLVTLSRVIDESTLDDQSFLLTADGIDVTGTRVYDSTSRQARFSPDTPIVSGVAYEVTVTTDVTTTAGTRLDQNDYAQGNQPFVREFDREMPGIRLKGFIPMSGVGDVWIDNRIVYVAGRSSGTSIYVVDANDEENPNVIAEVRNMGFVQDIKAQGDWMYATNEPGGIRIFDVTDPADPSYVRRIFDNNTQSVHNVSLFQTYLLASSNNTGRIEIYDVWNPATPMPIGSISNPNPGAQIHDQMVFGNRVYGAFLDGGLTISDFSDPTSPTTIIDHSYPDDFCHNAWPTMDERYLFTSDEYAGGPMRVWDITNVQSPREVAVYTPAPASVIHNVLVDGDLAFISFYTQGLRIVDVQNPPQPREVQFYDTFPNRDANANMDGAWGVHIEDDLVAITDMETGLYLFRFDR